MPKKKPKGKKKFSSITILIPAHNEEKYIAESIQSVINAKFPGKKEIIVVDDGSKDKTYSIAKKFSCKVIKQKHSGKSYTINKVLTQTKSELFAVIDGDSIIHEDSLINCLPYLADKKTPAICSVVRVKNRKSFLGMWLHIEQLYNSLIRGFFTKVNANIVTPGPLSIYKTKELKDIGGFSEKGFGEDIDIAVRFLQKGYKVEFAENSYSDTYMPVDLKGFTRQRKRFAQSWLDIFKRHLKLDKTFLEIFTLPLAVFSYLQALFMGAFQLYSMFSGYYHYFLSKGVTFSTGVVLYFLDWISIVGLVKWATAIFTGAIPVNPIDIIALSASLLSYPLYILAIFKYDKHISIWHIIPLFFMSPFWLVIMIFYIVNIPQLFNNKRMNIWVKN